MDSTLPFFLDSPTFPGGAMRFTLPGLAQHSEKKLSSVPKEVLENCLQPVLRGLENIDAKSLLNLKQVAQGARLAPG